MIPPRHRRGTQNRSVCFYLCRRCYEFVLQHHRVLKCHIQRLRSWYAEERAQQKRSGLDVCQKSRRYKPLKAKPFLFNHKRVCAPSLSQKLWLVPRCLFQQCSPQPLPSVSFCIVHQSAAGSLDAWEINDAVRNPYEFISGPWYILAAAPVPCTFIIMICHFHKLQSFIKKKGASD